MGRPSYQEVAGGSGDLANCRDDPKRVERQEVRPLLIADGVEALAMNYTHAIFNAITDWVCSLVPIVYIKRSKLPARVKWASGSLLVLAAVFGAQVPLSMTGH